MAKRREKKRAATGRARENGEKHLYLDASVLSVEAWAAAQARPGAVAWRIFTMTAVVACRKRGENATGNSTSVGK